MKDSRYWGTRLKFFKGLTGEEIENQYNLITNDDNKDMSATQIFIVEGKKDSETGERIFDAFFYYKSKFADVKGI